MRGQVTMKRIAWALAVAALSSLSNPARAKVVDVSDRGFVIRHIVEVPAGADATWAVLVKPAVWWDSKHTWSRNAGNLTLDARPGGCFCELLPGDEPKAPLRGGVEHMRVIYVEKPRALRMSGALGPLQSDAEVGTLTVQLKVSDQGDGTQILVEYVVGGYSRVPFDKLAPAVDAMLGGQFQSLAIKLGATFPAASLAPEAEGPPVVPAAPADGGVLPLSDRPLGGSGQGIGR